MTASKADERRFGGINRLADAAALDCLSQSSVCVAGIGGVGSWAAEALARTGVGHLLLIDLDHIALSNVNRQIHAVDATLGKAKVIAMQERIASYAPDCTVRVIDEFASAENLPLLLDGSGFPGGRLGALLDCCDQTTAKIAMARYAVSHKLPFIMAGSAGGKWQAERLQLTDLAASTQDPLLSKIRYQLRRQYGFERNPARKMRVACVWSDEPVKRGTDCDPSAGLSCAGYGSLVTTTASMGMMMAGWAIRQLLAARKAP